MQKFLKILFGLTQVLDNLYYVLRDITDNGKIDGSVRNKDV